MHILLTGATGFLGNNLLRLFLNSGNHVSVVFRQKSLPPALEGLDFQPIVCQLEGADFTQHLPTDVDVIVHSAAQIQIGKTKLNECRAINVNATESLARFALHHQKRLIHVSTVDTLAYSADGRPQTENDLAPAKPPATYVTTKKEAESAVRNLVPQGLDLVIVHPGFMLGYWDWKPSSAEMMLSIAKYRPPFAPAGGASVVDVRDVAQGIYAAIERGKSGESYILGGENIPYLALWQKMAKTIGCRGPRFPLPNWLARTSGLFGDIKTKLTQNETNINSIATRLGQLHHYYSSDKARSDLGYATRPAEEAIEACGQWCRDRKWLKANG